MTGSFLPVNEKYLSDGSMAKTDPANRYLVELGERIRRLREERKLGTQVELAAKLGISEATLRKLESGRGAPPQVHTLIALAALARTSVEYLATGTHAPSAGPADGELLGRLFEVLTSVYEGSPITMTPLELGRLAADEHNAAADEPPEAWPTILRTVERRHRALIAADTPAKRVTKRGA